MDNLTDLKAIWLTASTDQLPDATEMVQIIQKFRVQRVKKKWVMIILGSLMATMIVALTYFANFKLASTYVGAGLIAASCLYFVVDKIMSLKRFYQPYNYSNREYLHFIEQTRINQIYYYKKTQLIIMGLSSLGLLLYLFEPAMIHFFSTMLLFIVTIACQLYSWFVVRPRNFNKNQEKLELLRKRIENISHQLNQYEKPENE